jgi:NAD(P)-dependent dehydrogenase (short-subunit alcohol dehydrogenase family)
MQLKGAVVLVTGAGRGWGRSIALAFSRAAARVVVVSRTETEIRETAQRIVDEGGEAYAVAADLGTPEGINKTFAAVHDRYARLDVLVNNAAILKYANFAETSEEDIRLLVNVNLLSTMLLCRRFLPDMIARRKGCIINVSSNAGIWPFEKETVYTATKFAIEGFSRSLAFEVQQHGIAVNTITPGGTDKGVRIKPTNMLESELAGLEPAERTKYTDSIKYTEACLYLAMQDGARVTGQRVLAYELSESIRREGWEVPYRRLEQVRPGWLK